MCFSVEDDDLLEKYDTISDTVSADIKNEFDSELAYNKKLKTYLSQGIFVWSCPRDYRCIS